MSNTRYVFSLLVLMLCISFNLYAQNQEDAVKEFNKGNEHYQNDRYDEAISSLTEAIKIYAEYPAAYNIRGYCYYFKKEYDIAISDHKEAIRLIPGYADAFLNLGRCYESKGDSATAVKSFNEGIRLNPKEAYGFRFLGDFYLNRKNYNDAVSNYNEIIRLDPKNLEGYRYRAKVFVAKEEFDKVVREYEKIVAIEPNNSNAYNWIAYYLHRQSKYDQAIIAAKKRIELTPKDKKAYEQLGDIYLDQENYDLALSTYSEIIRLDFKDPFGYQERARVYDRRKEYDKAINENDLIIKVDPNNSKAYTQKIYYYRKQKKYDLALLEVNNAIKLFPTNNQFYVLRATIYEKLGDYDLAIQDYKQYVSLKKDVSSYLSRAWFFFRLKLYDLALKDFDEALKINSKDFSLYRAKGRFYRLTGQYDLAMQEYEKLLQIEPAISANTVWGRGKLYKAKGQYQLAINDLQTSITLSPKSRAFYLDIFSPLLRSGQFEKAKQFADSFLLLDNSSFDYDEGKFYKPYFKIIRVNLPVGQYKEALENVDEAITFYTQNNLEDGDDDKSDYYDLLALKGYILEKLSRFPEAKEVYEQALIINSNQPDVKGAIAAISKKSAVIASSDKAPPTIKLISPQNSRGLQIVSGNKTEIVGKAIDPSGIATITINGKLITKIEEDGLFTAAISLIEGSNSILINAVDKKGNIATKTFTLIGSSAVKIKEVEIMPVAVTDIVPVYHAILIAEKDYTDPSIMDLENPIKDATELKTILEANYTFNAKNIETLYNKSREEIMQAIVQKSNTLTENDNLLIFYAGHGIAEKDKFGDVDGYWVPSSAKKGLNATYISSDDINKALKRSNAKHILVIADACFSGAFTRELPTDASVGVQKQYSVPSRKIMASGNMEPVPDNSRFIFYLKKNLKENKEKYLTSKKLFDSFYEAILNNSDTSPQYAAIKNVGDEGGEFVFIKK